MEQLTLTPAGRRHAHRAYGRSVDAFDAVAWRPPTPVRFDGKPANDVPHSEPALVHATEGLPGWVLVIAGGVGAALMGALLGGMLQI